MKENVDGIRSRNRTAYDETRADAVRKALFEGTNPRGFGAENREIYNALVEAGELPGYEAIS